LELSAKLISQQKRLLTSHLHVEGIMAKVAVGFILVIGSTIAGSFSENINPTTYYQLGYHILWLACAFISWLTGIVLLAVGIDEKFKDGKVK
jgi:hypothetical protein